MSIISPKNTTNEDYTLDTTLRPSNFDEYIGQNKIKNNLKILIQAARERKEPIEHVLLSGSAGLGKTTLANIIAKESRANLRVTSGPAIEKVGDLASILTNLSDGDVFFIDECHRLNKTIEEVLYPAMEDYKLDIIIGKGPSARTLQIDLPRFTLVAATTKIGALSSPLRSRFGISFRLDFYTNEEIKQIIKRSARILNIEIDDQAMQFIAQSSRCTPRIANRLLKRVRDFAQVAQNSAIDPTIARKALEMLEIDYLGLEPIDISVLRAIVEKFNGGPVGLQTLAAAVNEDENTLEEVYEPYLMQIGFLARTPRGRIITPLGYKHLGINFENQNQLL